MRSAVMLAVGVLALAAAGCTSNTLDRHFRSGELSEVVRIFEADSSLHAKPGALYRAGLAYAMPESPVYDAERALEVFDRLQTLHPGHSQWEHVSQLQQLLHLAGMQQERQLSRDARLRALQAELDELKAQLARERTRADRLDREVRERDSRIRSLQDELTALKRIDLNRPPAGGVPAARPPSHPHHPRR